MPRKGESSNRWLDRQRRDQYVQAARADGYRSRAAYKLLELDERFELLRPGRAVLDLGAAPGGWSQVAARRVGERGLVVAVDRLAIDSMAGVTLLQLELGDEASFEAVRDALGGRPPDLVMCDLAPNMTGVKVADQLQAIGSGRSSPSASRSTCWRTVATSWRRSSTGRGWPRCGRNCARGSRGSRTSSRRRRRRAVVGTLPGGAGSEGVRPAA